jgi:hypothetical protein
MQRYLFLIVTILTHLVNSSGPTYSPTQLTNLRAAIVCYYGQYLSALPDGPYSTTVNLDSPGD